MHSSKQVKCPKQHNFRHFWITNAPIVMVHTIISIIANKMVFEIVKFAFISWDVILSGWVVVRFFGGLFSSLFFWGGGGL